MLNIIVPVDFHRGVLYALRHMFRLMKLQNENVVVKFAVNPRSNLILRWILNRFDKGNIIICKYSGGVNRSKLRNYALREVEGKVLLCDLDVILPKEIIDRCLRSKREDFLMFPCVYCRFGAQNKNLKTKRIRELRKSYTHIAIPSSIICFQKNEILFDEGYVGHGYEDFDFIIRYLVSVNKYKITDEDLLDETYDSAILAQGFRAKLAVFAIDQLRNGLIARHIYHRKGKKSDYKEERNRNARRFRVKIETMISAAESHQSSHLECSFPLTQYIDKTYPLNLLML
ncbi:hypothetical protein [Sutterella megalosphaeroides]|uniref:Capsular polysaccharide biosynthesis protein n=1 Tax=Sutterella megalosphaeroides TaxID=2494234 RepID=A0A2Z6IAU0_9BURK|nr:hypothetical protein [Sutterella megalosphaeroides]BBF23569.1 capsular polysaccharide biosynthesis protein [Sutterella megalosphaeroides]